MPLKNWNVSNGRDFDSMFYNCYLLSDIKCFEKWDISNVNTLSRMFCGCIKLNEIESLIN